MRVCVRLFVNKETKPSVKPVTEYLNQDPKPNKHKFRFLKSPRPLRAVTVAESPPLFSLSLVGPQRRATPAGGLGPEADAVADGVPAVRALWDLHDMVRLHHD